jgi:ribonuclease H2 subunit A
LIDLYILLVFESCHGIHYRLVEFVGYWFFKNEGLDYSGSILSRKVQHLNKRQSHLFSRLLIDVFETRRHAVLEDKNLSEGKNIHIRDMLGNEEAQHRNIWREFDQLREMEQQQGHKRRREEKKDDQPVKKDRPTQFVLGIDEAGRGPVLGPMIYACAACPVEDHAGYKTKGYRDSKQVKPRQRNLLFEKLKKEPNFKYSTSVISAADITEGVMRDPVYNLNQMSHDAAIGLVRQMLADGLDVAALYVDTVGVASKYQAQLAELFPDIPTIVVESKADAKYPIVSVASIIAKVTRDRCMETLQKENAALGDLGSGYPGDAKTKAWLERQFDRKRPYPEFVRVSWGTVKEIYLKNGAIPPI